ncbi:MAG: membrane protein insertase YidC [Desulfohalobiaceae bacterium]|nr:membrane protein insertase YidC [Desulfohalobiaceae bacterium]
MNDNWRILLALGLTMVVLVGWNLLFPPEQPVQTGKNSGTEVRQQSQAPGPAAEMGNQTTGGEQPVDQQPSHGALPASEFQEQTGRRITVDTPLYQAVINTRGGILEHFLLKKYDETIEEDSPPVDLVSPESRAKAPMGLLLNLKPTWSQGKWSLEGKDLHLQGMERGELTLRGNLNGLILERRLIFEADTYQISEELSVINKTQGLTSGFLGQTMASQGLVENENRYNRTNMIYYQEENGLEREDDTDDLSVGLQPAKPVKWAGIDSNYFLLALVPTSGDAFLKGVYEQGIYRVSLETNLNLQPGQRQDLSAIYFLGPKKKSLLAPIPKDLEESIYYGYLNIVAKPLVQLLKFFYGFVGNYGVAILLLTLVIKILFWPLTHKSYKSMEKMKKIQPMMKELKEKHKDDRTKMNQELMQLYKTYKVNPAGGCLPMLLQIPVFIGLYEALLGSVELRHAPFISHVPFTDIVWLADLAAKDPLYVTPVIMGLSMFLQQKLSPTAGDPTQAKIMMIMPLFLTFIFLNFPSGLVVYFFANNMISILQQWYTLRNV